MIARAGPRLIAITDAARRGIPATCEMARRVCSAPAGFSAVLLRDYELSTQSRLALGAELRRITRGQGQLLVVGRRLDIGVVVEADGIHLPHHGPTIGQLARQARQRELLLSVPWHLGEPLADEADWILASPVMATRKGKAPLGVVEMKSVVKRCRQQGSKVYALGGVDEENCSLCMVSGADGVAAIGASYDAPEALLRALASG